MGQSISFGWLNFFDDMEKEIKSWSCSDLHNLDLNVTSKDLVCYMDFEVGLLNNYLQVPDSDQPT